MSNYDDVQLEVEAAVEDILARVPFDGKPVGASRAHKAIRDIVQKFGERASRYEPTDFTPPCVFCSITQGHEIGMYVWDTPQVVGIEPLNPVTEGHVIFMPRSHVSNALTDADITATVMRDAVKYVQEQPLSLVKYTKGIAGWNFITSVGEAATQTVGHLHIHVVPRRVGDNLALPWTGQGKS